MARLTERFKHAFAVDPSGPAEPTEQQRLAVDWFCNEITRRQLTTPAIIALEMSRPLTTIAANAMHFLSPAAWAIINKTSFKDYQHFSTFLEKRGSLEYLIQRILSCEADFERRERAAASKDKPDSTP